MFWAKLKIYKKFKVKNVIFTALKIAAHYIEMFVYCSMSANVEHTPATLFLGASRINFAFVDLFQTNHELAKFLNQTTN